MGQMESDGGYCSAEAEEGLRRSVEVGDQPGAALDLGNGLVVDFEFGNGAAAVERDSEDAILCRGAVRADVPVEFIILAADAGEAPGVVVEHECAGRIAGGPRLGEISSERIELLAEGWIAQHGVAPLLHHVRELGGAVIVVEPAAGAKSREGLRRASPGVARDGVDE